MLTWSKLFLIALITSLLISPVAVADEKTEKTEQLKTLLSRIDKLKQTIDVKEDSKSRYIVQLKNIESKISVVSKEIRLTGQNIKSRKTALRQLQKKRNQHQQNLSRENEYLAEQVYAAFTLGKQERVKLLFSQQNPQAFQRNLVYYQYFSNARVDLINGVETSIEAILDSEKKIKLATAELVSIQQALKTQKTALDKDRNKRESIIGSLDKQLKKQGGHLVRLEDEANQLQNLINSIQQIFDEAPELDISRKAFAELRGKLAWPVKGKVRKLFGRNKMLSDLTWQGIIIEAAEGNHVKSVSHGRVAFADWLRGFGNLIIIDHGNSYLSLYGHNESLFKSAGEWVETGEIISSIGNSGGQQKTGLYFEIRKKGKPQNPTRWCKSGNQFPS